MKFKILTRVLTFVFILFAGIFIGYLISQKRIAPKTESPKNVYLTFLFEVYDKIKENYWDKITDEQLTDLYTLGTEKLTGQALVKPKDKTSLQNSLVKVLDNLQTEQKKKEFTAALADLVLANLGPFGRSRLYSQKEETDLKNRVENKNPGVDQYQVLGLKKGASSEEIKKVYEEKKQEVEKDKSPEAQQKLAQINNAYGVLANESNRKVYDQSGVEPTMESKLLRPNIFYLHIKKFSPTTIDELVRITNQVDKGDVLNSLILDLRDNVGGAIDGLPYFIGPFIGNDQYAYQFLHQGEKQDFKTKIGWLPSLVRYKRVVILINEGTQSTAEVMAAALKKYNVGIVVGTPTKGWGTVEKVFNINQQIAKAEKYSIFLVHSLTLREDGQPIEGKGVEPVINIKTPNWETLLYPYFHDNDLIATVKEVIK